MFFSRKNIFPLLLLLIFFGLAVLFAGHPRKMEVMLGGKTFSVEIADNNISRTRGLSGHAPLSAYGGMIFIFQKADTYGFWMKDMLFPLDIIWIDSNFKINHIESSLSPQTYPKVFYPEGKSLYVLEVSAGQANSLNLEVGDSVKFGKN